MPIRFRRPVITCFRGQESGNLNHFAPDPSLPRTRDARGRFARGSSGNPGGRPRGIPNPKRRVPDLAARPLSARALSDLIDRRPHLSGPLARRVVAPLRAVPAPACRAGRASVKAGANPPWRPMAGRAALQPPYKRGLVLSGRSAPPAGHQIDIGSRLEERVGRGFDAVHARDRIEYDLSLLAGVFGVTSCKLISPNAS